ncbi:MATH and LRR domain-containing protein [Apis mellifera carnica]|nr:MATH and LRR domain-containing protein [Apis mellifera carnica]
MNCVVEERINNIQSENALIQDTKKEMIKNSGKLKLNNDESKLSIIELFPWILEFRKMCKCIHTEKSMASLKELMKFYLRNISVSVNECYTRPLRAGKLKDFISDSLMLFLYIYRELSKDCDRFSYLNIMSDLLAFYIDMELKASRKSREDHDKICARITSCLYVYLEHSMDYLLDTLMKIQFMCRSYHHILDPIMTKIIKSIPTHPESDIMYIRYFFIYRLWRKINENVAVKNQITTAAIASLGPLPLTFSSSILEDVLPKVPKSQPNSTKSLLQQKFDIKKHCVMFTQYCKENNGSVYQDGPATPIDSSSRINSKMVFIYPEDIVKEDVEYIDNNINSIISNKNKQNESISLLKTFKSLNLEKQTSFKCLEIINRIVGIYPEDALDVALHVEVTSNETNNGNNDSELCKVIFQPETNLNYDTDTLTHNLAPIENNVQTVKENTNVILNGETVVLLQKSPNSNLYIINKAIENSKDHNNDEENNRLKEKNWISQTEDCGQFETLSSLDHVSCNLDLTPYQENKCSIVRGKGIKIEWEDNFSDMKTYSTKLSTDMLSINSQIYQDINVMNKSIDKRKSNSTFRQNIKQEFNISNHMASNCAIPGFSGIHSHPREVDSQHPLHIPATHPTTLPAIYGNCADNTELCVPYHKHCTSVSYNVCTRHRILMCLVSKVVRISCQRTLQYKALPSKSMTEQRMRS